jgi:hypothetical protein
MADRYYWKSLKSAIIASRNTEDRAIDNIIRDEVSKYLRLLDRTPYDDEKKKILIALIAETKLGTVPREVISKVIEVRGYTKLLIDIEKVSSNGKVYLSKL